jgi:hypothetical protein
VPGTAWRVRQSIDTWVAMCADGTLVLGPINDDQHARTTYGVSAKHLNNVRRAAVTGALRRCAGQLGVPLPVTYVTTQPPQRQGAGGRLTKTSRALLCSGTAGGGARVGRAGTGNVQERSGNRTSRATVHRPDLRLM